METDLGSKQVIGLRRGDVVSFRLSGAGGYGDPRQRDSLQVRRDVRNGYISEATARDLYGC
jgi:N-methylhydantoinase B